MDREQILKNVQEKASFFTLFIQKSCFFPYSTIKTLKMFWKHSKFLGNDFQVPIQFTPYSIQLHSSLLVQCLQRISEQLLFHMVSLPLQRTL